MCYQGEYTRQYLLKCLSIGIIICISKVDPLSGFKYKYSLLVDGKPYEQFKENQAKAMKTWETVVNSSAYRIVLGSTAFPLFLRLNYMNSFFVEKNTMNIFLNGKLVDENVMVQRFKIKCNLRLNYFLG